jgi:hypothetical protein
MRFCLTILTTLCTNDFNKTCFLIILVQVGDSVSYMYAISSMLRFTFLGMGYSQPAKMMERGCLSAHNPHPDAATRELVVKVDPLPSAGFQTDPLLQQFAGSVLQGWAGYGL